MNTSAVGVNGTSAASGSFWGVPAGVPRSVDVSTVVLSTVISTLAMSLQGSVQKVLGALLGVLCSAAQQLLRLVFVCVQVPLTAPMTSTLETVVSPLHGRLRMVHASGFSSHLPRPGWYLVKSHPAGLWSSWLPQSWLRWLSGFWRCIIAKVALGHGATRAPAVAAPLTGRGKGSRRATNTCKPSTGAIPTAPPPLPCPAKADACTPSHRFWALLFVPPQSFAAMHQYMLLENQTGMHQKTATTRDDTYMAQRASAPSDTMGSNTTVMLYTVKGCAAALRAFIAHQTSCVVEVPDSAPAFDALHNYVLRKVQMEGTQLVGSMLTTRNAVGMEHRMLYDRQYRVPALDGTPLIITANSSGMSTDTFTSSKSLFVRLGCPPVEGRDPVTIVRGVVDAIAAAAQGRPKIQILTYMLKGMLSGKKDGSAGTWHAVKVADQRSLDSVCLDAKRRTALVQDIADFCNSGELYRKLGVPWKRSYLLHGPPGTGKTSLLRAIATHFGLHICFVQVTTRHTDEDLANMFNSVPPKCMVVFEDVDRVTFADPIATHPTAGPPPPIGVLVAPGPPGPEDPKRKYKSLYAFTLQGLLNALDGVVEASCRLCFLTANHPDMLDAALRRKGRIDVDVHMDLMRDTELVRCMASRFFPTSSRADMDALVNRVMVAGSGAVSPCELQGFCMRFAIKGIKAALTVPTEELLQGDM